MGELLSMLLMLLFNLNKVFHLNDHFSQHNLSFPMDCIWLTSLNYLGFFW